MSYESAKRLDEPPSKRLGIRRRMEEYTIATPQGPRPRGKSAVMLQTLLVGRGVTSPRLGDCAIPVRGTKNGFWTRSAAFCVGLLARTRLMLEESRPAERAAQLRRALTLQCGRPLWQLVFRRRATACLARLKLLTGDLHVQELIAKRPVFSEHLAEVDVARRSRWCRVLVHGRCSSMRAAAVSTTPPTAAVGGQPKSG